MPPETIRQPLSAMASQRAAELATTCFLVVLPARLEGLGEGHRLGGDGVHERPALDPGEDRLVDGLGPVAATQDDPAAGAAEGLVGRRRHEMAVGHRRRVKTRGHQPGDVGDVGHEQRTGLIGDGAQTGEIDDPRIGRGAADDELGLVLDREFAEAVVVDGLGVLVHPVGHDLVLFAGLIERVAVGEVAAVGEIHAEHGVAGGKHREIDRHVGLGARVGLNVGVLSSRRACRPVRRASSSATSTFWQPP